MVKDVWKSILSEWPREIEREIRSIFWHADDTEKIAEACWWDLLQSGNMEKSGKKHRNQSQCSFQCSGHGLLLQDPIENKLKVNIEMHDGKQSAHAVKTNAAVTNIHTVTPIVCIYLEGRRFESTILCCGYRPVQTPQASQHSPSKKSS